jgi:hypothetical protein
MTASSAHWSSTAMAMADGARRGGGGRGPA